MPLVAEGRWAQRQTRAQYAAIARLRWRMLVNIARRTNTPGEIAGRVILYLVMTCFAVFLTLAAGGAAWLLVREGHLRLLWLLFWGIFALCQLLNINLGQPGTTFDPTQLIRFPLGVPTYVAIRLFFNLLSPANIMAMLMSLAAAVGIVLAQPRLWLYASAASTVFAVTNVLFSRMIFAWVDRWLSTRRAREVFTAAVFVLSLSFQYVNFTFNPGLNRSHGRSRQHGRQDGSPGGRPASDQATRQRVDEVTGAYRRAEPLLRFTPPNLIGQAIGAGAEGRPAVFLAETAGCAAYAALFLLVFALRTRTEFRGESLSDTAARSTLPALPLRPHPAVRAPAGRVPPAPGDAKPGLLPGPLVALLGKEWTYMRRNTGLLYGLVTPLFLVVLFALRMGRNVTSAWIVPMAIAYSLVGIAPMSYNSFGLDGTGAQLYFMAPVPLRRVFFAKNLMHFAMAALEVAVVLGVMSYVSHPPPVVTLLGILLWVCGSLLLNTSLGNRRSITAPKKINLGRMSGKQASQGSSLLSLGVLVACVAYGAGVLALAAWSDRPWLSLPCFAALAAAGLVVYRQSLDSLQAFTLAHRDSLFEELGKS